MLNLRIRPVNDDGSTDESTRVIATQQITYTGVFNSVSTISFDVSRDDWQPTAYPFVVRVEYSTGGRYVPLPEHDLFIIERDSDDSKDAGRIVTYQGIAYVPWILTGTYVGVGPWNVDGERTIDNGPANAGRILDYFFTESTSRGPWLKHLDWNFNGTRDSANVLWKTEDREEFAWRVDQHWYGEMLAQLADQSLCEWTVMGTELQLFRPGTRGVDRSETIQLGGPRFDRVPVETDTQGQFTHVISTYDEGRTWTTNTDAEARFGRRSVAASHTGVKTAAGSKRLAQKLLSGGQEVKREEAYEWTPTTGDVSPFRDFSLGDLVSAVSRGAKNSRRVIGVIITQSADEVTVQARVGERISTLAAKNQKALEAVTGGSIPGGTGGVFPTVPPVEKSVPAGPVGLHVVSNTGEFTSVGARATVVLAWSPVTETVTGEEVVITEYALYQDGVEVLRTHNTSVSVEMPSVVSRDFQVVAFAGADRRSDPSATVSVTGALPAAFDLDPTPPVLSSSHGNVRAVWDGLYTTAAPAGAHTIRVEARVQGTGPWIMQGAALTSGGEQLVSVGAIGDTVEVRFTAYDQLQRLTGTSATASIEVKGVRNGDLDEALKQAVQEGRDAKNDALEALNKALEAEGGVSGALDAIQDLEDELDPRITTAQQEAQEAWDQALAAMNTAVDAQTSADDKSTIHYGNSAPVRTDHKVGDTWFDGSNGNRINVWDGSNWVPKFVDSGAISDTVNDKIDEAFNTAVDVADEQVVMGRTVDGLNRTFTSVNSPGTGYVGHENLAPPIVGSESWVEVRRNLRNDPRATQPGTYVAVGDGTRTQPYQNGEGMHLEQTGPAWVGVDLAQTGLTDGKYTISFESTDGIIRQAWNLEWQNLSFEYFEEGGRRYYTFDLSGSTGIRYRVSPEDSSEGSKATFRNFLIEQGGPSPYFDGSFTSDPDMRTRWLGEPNESESVMEAERIASPPATMQNGINFLSTKFGTPNSMRMRGTHPTSTDTSSVIATMTTTLEAGKTYSYVLKSHLEEDRTRGARVQAVGNTVAGWTGSTTIINDYGPATAGTREHRGQFTIPADFTWLNFRIHGNEAAGEPDIWYSDINLFEGTLPEDAQRLHNGDQWFRLEEIGGELLHVETLVWNGQDWVPHKMHVDSIAATNSISADKIIFNQGFADEFWANEGNFGKITAGSAVIADSAITNAKIGNLDASKITTGELEAARVKMDAAFVNKMAANKILVSGDNLIKNTDFMGGGWTRTNSQNSVVFAPDTGPSGKPAVMASASGSTNYAAYYAGTTTHKPDWVIPVNGAEEFRATVWVYSATAIPAHKVGIGVVRYTETYSRVAAATYYSSSIPANTWSQVSVTLTTASNTRSIGLYFPVAGGHSSDIYFSDPELVRKATGELIVDGTITGDKVNATSVAAKIGEFVEVRGSNIIGDTGAMNSAFIGQLVSDNVFANSLYANRVLVSPEELAPGPGGFEDVYQVIRGTISHPTTAFAATQNGQGVFRFNGGTSSSGEARGPIMPVKAGQKYHIEAFISWYGSSTTGGYTELRAEWFNDPEGTRLSYSVAARREDTTGGALYGGTVTAPADARYGRFYIYTPNQSGAGDVAVFNISFKPQVGSVLIENGAVKADKMDADEIYGDEAHMNVLASGLVATDEVTGLGNSLNITANESIELAVGRQNATDQQLSELREDVDDNTDATEQAATVANDAHIAALAAGADLVAQNSRLEGVESGLSDQQAHFKILPNGVQVAFDDQSASLDMTPQSIRFMSQGTAVAEISQEAIIIHKGIFEQAQIGNHLMQKRGNRTTFTPIEGS